MGSRAFSEPPQAPLIMTSVEITEKLTKRGRTYIATLSSGVVVRRSSTKPKLYFAFFTSGEGYTICSNSLNYISTHGAVQREDFLVVEIATNRIIPMTLAPKEQKRLERKQQAEAKKEVAFERFQKAPKRLMNSMYRDMEFWQSHHPTYPVWAACAKWCEECTQNELRRLFDIGIRTSGDLGDYLEKKYSELKQHY